PAGSRRPDSGRVRAAESRARYRRSRPRRSARACAAAGARRRAVYLAADLERESGRPFLVKAAPAARTIPLFFPFDDCGLAWPLSAQRRHPACDGPPDLVRRIFLNEMDPRHRLLGQRWPPADEVDQPIIGENRTWLSLQEQLGHIARPQPVRVFSRDRMHIGGLALDGDLPGPRQRRPSPLARLGERASILRHLLVGELTQDGVRQDLFNE